MSLSNGTKDFQALVKGLKEASDIRKDRVQEMSRNYGEQSCHPDYREVAA